MNIKELVKRIAERECIPIIRNKAHEKMEEAKWKRTEDMIDIIINYDDNNDYDINFNPICIITDEGFEIDMEAEIIKKKESVKDINKRVRKILDSAGIPIIRNIAYENMQQLIWNIRKSMLEKIIECDDYDIDYVEEVVFEDDNYEFKIVPYLKPIQRRSEDTSINNREDQDIKITLNVDTTPHNSKPIKKEISIIQNNLAKGKRTITIDEFIKVIEHGGSFKSAALNGNKNIDWESQQIFALDIDNDEKSIKKHGLLKQEDAYKRFSDLGVPPVFYYESFGSTVEKPKFRLIFILSNPVTDVRIRNAIQMALITIMPEADSSCKDLSRLFFGTNKKCKVFNNKNNFMDPYVLIQGLIVYVKERYSKDRKYLFNIKNYCKTVGLNIVNEVPDVRIVYDDNFVATPFTSILYIIEMNANATKKILFNFCIDKEMANRITINNNSRRKNPKFNINIGKVKYEKTIQRFNFDELDLKCKLWREFIRGERWCYHNEIFGISTNMWMVKGAEQRMIKAIENNSQYKETINNKMNTVQSGTKYGYLPMRCRNFCPYCDICLNKGFNMHHIVDNKRGQIRIVEDNNELIQLDLGTQILEKAIAETFKSNENHITIIKGGTGVGKTTVLKNLGNYNNTVISYSNHRLGNDIVKKLDIDNSIHLKEFVLEDKNIMNEFRRLQKIGAYREARKLIENYRTDIDRGIITNNIKDKKQIINDIDEYLLRIKKSRSTDKLIFCTHEKMLELKNDNINTYIIDEDILTTALIKTINIKIEDLERLINICKKVKGYKIEEQLYLLKQKMLEAINKPYQPIIISEINEISHEVQTILRVGKDILEINLRELLKMKAVIADNNGELLGISIRELPNKKCIILSATANEIIYRKLFPHRKINFIDIGNIELEGEVILHYTGCSRNKLNKNFEKVINKIKEEADGIKNMITFMKFEEKFKKEGFNVIAHFGACSGLDEYKGQNLIVVGTPHIDERVYLLIASIMEPDIQITERLKYVNVRKNGFEFFFNTYKNNDLLREVQFYLIESELVQAIGRARLLRTKAKVHLFSNFPVKGSVLYNEKNYNSVA